MDKIKNYIRAVKNGDIKRIAEIQLESWRDSYSKFISFEELYTKRDINSTEKMIEEIIKNHSYTTFVYVDRKIKGFVVYCNGEENNSIELYKIFVDPKSKGRGIGKSMLGIFEEKAFEMGKELLIIWTLRENHAAQKFYEKNMYTRDGKTKYNESWNMEMVRFTKVIEKRKIK